MRKAILLIVLICLSNCDDTKYVEVVKNEKSIEVQEQDQEQDQEQETVTIEVVKIIQEVKQEETKQEVNENMADKKNKIAIMRYDNNVVKMYDDFSIKKVDESDNYIYSDGYHSKDKEIYLYKKLIATTTNNIKDFRVYDKKTVLYQSDLGDIYFIDINKKIENMVIFNIHKRQLHFTDHGVHDSANTFVNSSGEIFQKDGIAYNGYKNIIKSVKTETGLYDKFIYNGSEWIKIGTSMYQTHYDRSHTYKFMDIVYNAKGVVIDTLNNTSVYPHYDRDVQKHVGGSAFVQFARSNNSINHNMYFIGDNSQDTLYCIDSYNGTLYKYNVESDELTMWINIAGNGCGSDDTYVSDKWFNSVNPVLVNNEWIIYCDGVNIKRFNVNTQENIIVCDASYFECWSM